MKRPELWMVFDVESVGLHGEGFAVGFVVVDGAGKELEACRFASPPLGCFGDEDGRDWVKTNVPDLGLATHPFPRQMRESFWARWCEWKSRGALLAADCAWPVEARFLAACVDDARPAVRSGLRQPQSERHWLGPYPLIDVASVRLAAGFDPSAAAERLTNELPAHDPLADARQSARLLLEALASTPAG